ncbi:heterokaryon incompatibility protein-domain-containing protein [Rhexocercosporidium sp. MPI-PUGE-AT-0058]|nr:heterokaryon incompatibility protein-domain-containing protein [Rhexocercosporidium sp. MPI-PUGE-AT-0058]
MASQFSAMSYCMNLSQSRSGPGQDSLSKPLYSPLPSVTLQQKPSGIQKNTTVPQDLIRLLKIFPGSAPNIVECELVVARLDTAPPYEALSYVWGDPEPLDAVICNGQRKSITTNLGIALKHLRLLDKARLIWVDALCINQEDVDERSSQIKLMRDIYTQTWRVVVWLGEDSDSKAQAAISLLERVAEECSQRLQLPIDQITLTDLLKLPIARSSFGETSLAQLSRNLPGEMEKNMEAAAWLCSHSWFRRIWVIQEVSFAPATVHIGTLQISWKAVALSATWFLMRMKVQNIEYRQAFSQVKDMFLIRDAVGSNYIILLQRVTPFEATDPRDKLFATLGLYRDADRFDPDFQPDYSKDVVEVYTKFARSMAANRLREITSGLSLLYPYYPDPNTGNDKRFPSWVPRWDGGNPMPGQTIGMLHWKVSGDTSAAIDKVIDPKILSIRGFRLAPTKLVHHGLHNEPQSLYIIQRMWDSITGCMKDGDLPTLDAKDFDERFTKTITAGSFFDSNAGYSEKDGLWGAKELHNYFDCMKLGVAGKHESILPENKRQAELLCAVAVKKAFFILEDGQIGMGPNATELKDMPCVFYGHKMPYMLRPVEDGRYLFLGPCYIHGIMHGEAMEGLKTGKYREEWLQIC